MVFLYFSRSAQQNRRGSNSLPGIPRMAEPFAGALPSPLDLTRFAQVEAASSTLPAAFQKEKPPKRPPDTRKHTVLPVSIRLKSTEKTPACVSMRAFLQPISARIYFGKTASHRKRARFVQSRGASPQAYWMSVKAAQRRGCAKRAFCGVCFLMPGGLRLVFLFVITLRFCCSHPRISPYRKEGGV